MREHRPHPRYLIRLARSLVAPVLRASLYMIIVFLTLEASARVDDYVTYGVPLLADSSFSHLVMFDSDGLRGRPGAQFEKWRMNNLGFRGRDVTIEKPRNRFRVVVLGASETFGLYESPGNEYPAVLERMLDERLDAPVEVLNAALAGMSLPRATEFCRRRLRALDPDVVIYYPTPVEYLDDRPPRNPPVTMPSAQSLEAPVLRIFYRGWTAARAVLPAALQHWLREAEIGRATRDKPDSWFFREVPQDRLRLFENHLHDMAECLQESATNALMGTHVNRFTRPLTPSEMQYLVAWRRFYPRADPMTILGMDVAGNEVIQRIGQSTGVTVVDLSQSVPPDSQNFQDFSHFTDRGASLVAGAFADAIVHLHRASPSR